jgi:hypothetical protein
MNSFARFGAASLVAAALVSGCNYGTGAILYVDNGPSGENTTGSGGTSTGSGGTSTGSGGTSTGAGGAQSGAGGTSIGSGGIATETGGTTGSGGMTTTGAGGTSIGSGGRTTTGAGGTSTGSGGTTGSGGASGGTTGAGGTSGWGTPVAGGPMGTGLAATVTVSLNSTVGTVGADFVGFSYEKTHLTNDSLNSTNTKLIALYKLLGTPLMRIGANDVDVSNWTGMGAGASAPSGQPFTHNIVSGDVDQLCSFLAATGTKVIYAVNFKSNNVTASSQEAAYAMSKCASSISGFEIGNEIDKYGSWASQQSQWETFANAITATPGALLIGPATTGGASSSFAVPFAASESAKFGSKLVLLTQHYYVAGAGSTGATAASLQTIKSDIPGIAGTMNTAATNNHVSGGYRIGECNTFSGHGQMGVSDTLISGLWSLDFMFENAIHGSSGVNFHGGETGMDGTRPFYYEPIMESNGAVVQAQPEYYGMLLMSQAGTGSAVSTTVSTSNPNFTAYAIKASGFTSVVLNNKNASTGVNATVDLGSAVSSASAIYLQGTPANSLSVGVTATTFVTLAGAQVSNSGVWNRNAPYIQTTSGHTVSVYVPPASAALVRVLQ